MAQLTEDQRRAYARIARDYPHKLGEVANRAGVKPETVKDWIRDYFGSTRGKQGIPPPRVPPIVPPVPPTPPVSRTTVFSATEEATNALAKRKRTWFRRKRRRRKDADKLRAIIADWKKDYKRTTVAQPWAVAARHPDRPPTPHGAERTDAPPPEGCNVYILDADLLSALASNDNDAWACLEALVGDLNALVAPGGAIGAAFRDEPAHILLERAFASSCIRQVPLDYAEARAAGMLCRATSASDLIDASVVAAAKACRQALDRRRTGRKCAVHIVTQDVNRMTNLIDTSGLSRRNPEPCRNWYLLAIAGSRQ